MIRPAHYEFHYFNFETHDFDTHWMEPPMLVLKIRDADAGFRGFNLNVLASCTVAEIRSRLRDEGLPIPPALMTVHLFDADNGSVGREITGDDASLVEVGLKDGQHICVSRFASSTNALGVTQSATPTAADACNRSSTGVSALKDDDNDRATQALTALKLSTDTGNAVGAAAAHSQQERGAQEQATQELATVSFVAAIFASISMPNLLSPPDSVVGSGLVDWAGSNTPDGLLTNPSGVVLWFYGLLWCFSSTLAIMSVLTAMPLLLVIGNAKGAADAAALVRELRSMAMTDLLKKSFLAPITAVPYFQRGFPIFGLISTMPLVNPTAFQLPTAFLAASIVYFYLAECLNLYLSVRPYFESHVALTIISASFLVAMILAILRVARPYQEKHAHVDAGAGGSTAALAVGPDLARAASAATAPNAIAQPQPPASAAAAKDSAASGVDAEQDPRFDPVLATGSSTSGSQSSRLSVDARAP